MSDARVLVVEGDVACAGTLRWLLRQHGFTVASPPVPRAVGSAIRRFEPDVVLAAADSIEWRELISELTEDGLREGTRVIIAGGTGYLREGTASIPDAHVRKPYCAENVVASVAAQYRIGCEMRSLRAGLTEAVGEVTRLRDASSSSRQLVEILHEVTAELSAGEIYRVLTRRVARSLSIGHCSVILARPGDASGTLVAAVEDPSITDMSIPLREYPEVAAALQAERPVVIEDVTRHRLFDEVLVSGSNRRIARTRSIVALPFSIDRSRTGVLSMSTERDGRALDLYDVEFAETVVRAAVAAIRRAQALETTRADNIRLEALATTDPLTRVLNRRALLERLTSEVDRARRYSSQVTMLILDLDHFKRINDTAGHLAGDDILRQVAILLEEAVRRVDIVARYGGEEFVVILPETSPDGAFVFSERLRERIAAHPFTVGPDSHLHLTVSIGVATFPAPRVDSTEDLFARADEALYRAKTEGRNRVRS